MDLIVQLEQELRLLTGFSSGTPRRCMIRDASGIEVSVDFVAVDTMSSSFETLSMHVPALCGHEAAVLSGWAEALSKRITYLLEPIGPIEMDVSGKQILIRSTPPDQSSGGTRFYEVRLNALSHGTFSLRRFKVDSGHAGREAVDIFLTNETLKKLVRDLIETIPEV